jgi:hypothetical protein
VILSEFSARPKHHTWARQSRAARRSSLPALSDPTEELQAQEAPVNQLVDAPCRRLRQRLMKRPAPSTSKIHRTRPSLMKSACPMTTGPSTTRSCWTQKHGIFIGNWRMRRLLLGSRRARPWTMRWRPCGARCKRGGPVKRHRPLCKSLPFAKIARGELQEVQRRLNFCPC